MTHVAVVNDAERGSSSYLLIITGTDASRQRKQLDALAKLLSAISAYCQPWQDKTLVVFDFEKSFVEASKLSALEQRGYI